MFWSSSSRFTSFPRFNNLKKFQELLSLPSRATLPLTWYLAIQMVITRNYDRFLWSSFRFTMLIMRSSLSVQLSWPCASFVFFRAIPTPHSFRWQCVSPLFPFLSLLPLLLYLSRLRTSPYPLPLPVDSLLFTSLPTPSFAVLTLLPPLLHNLSASARTSIVSLVMLPPNLPLLYRSSVSLFIYLFVFCSHVSNWSLHHSRELHYRWFDTHYFRYDSCSQWYHLRHDRDSQWQDSRRYFDHCRRCGSYYGWCRSACLWSYYREPYFQCDVSVPKAFLVGFGRYQYCREPWC